MKDLMAIASECMVMLDDLNIEYGNITKWEVNTRAKNRWGQCRKLPNGDFSINISSVLLEDDVDIQSVETTVLHELLHSVKGVKGHGPEWKRLADKVNKAYGYNIKRCTSSEEKGIAPIQTTPKTVKHKFVCTDCGQTIERLKESKFTKDYNKYRCGVCHGKFEKIF